MAKAKAKSVTAEFNKDKETKRTVRYREDAERDDQLVGSIYLKNEVVEQLGEPESISVEITPA